MMVQMIAPRPNERVGDLAGAPAASGSMPTNTSWSSTPRRRSSSTTPTAGPQPGGRPAERGAAGAPADAVLRAFDNDSGMTMLRIGSMNLMLHGIESPSFFYMDTLSKAFNETREYDVILMNRRSRGGG